MIIVTENGRQTASVPDGTKLIAFQQSFYNRHSTFIGSSIVGHQLFTMLARSFDYQEQRPIRIEIWAE